MSANRMLCAMIAGTALVVLVAARPQPNRVREPAARPHEEPWLTPEAAAQIIGREGSLGPLFEGVELGGSAPSPAVRARIAEFARANHVEIDLEVVDDELVAVRFDVTFGGCCGYEGADVLALRMGRPQTWRCCGCDSAWINDWATTSENGVYMRARVRVNRVAVRWERTITLPDTLERADGLLGKNASTIRKTASDRWTELEPGHRYMLEMPFPFGTFPEFRVEPVQFRDDLGVQVRVERGRIVEVSIALRERNDQAASDIAATLRKRWGRPRIVGDTRTWRKPDRIVTAELDPWPKKITIAATR